MEKYQAAGSPLSGPSLRTGEGPTERAVILLHGYGANGMDLIGLGQQLGQGIDNCLFVAPDAPDGLPGYPSGRQWYPINTLEPRSFGEGAERARPVVDGFIDALLADTGLAPDRLVLLGFSQGGMMALETAYRRTAAVAAVISFSGALPEPDRFAREIVSKPPALLIHGQADPVVPFGMMAPAAQALTSQGVEVLTHAIPELPHGIDGRGLNSAYTMLRRVFG